MLIFDPTVLGFGRARSSRESDRSELAPARDGRISHLPEPILPLGVPDQNSADARPLFRAAFDNLTKWTQWRVRPPAPQYFRGRVDATGIFIPETDGDGHFAGGVRLPHVESIVHGHAAGAPLGRYTPLNPRGLDPFNPFVFIGGTFTRFTDDTLLARYRSRGQYVRRVARAADRLARQAYITNADRNTLIQSAQREPLLVPRLNKP